MNDIEFKNFISERGKVSIPEFQSEFALSYKEARDHIKEMEAKDLVKFDGELYYFYNSERKEEAGDDSSLPGNDENKERLRAIRRKIEALPPEILRATEFSVKEREISISKLQREFRLPFPKAANILETLTGIGVLARRSHIMCEATISEEEFKAMFENVARRPDDDSDFEESENNEPDESPHSLDEILSGIVFDDDKDDEDEDEEEDEDDEDDEDDEEDEDDSDLADYDPKRRRFSMFPDDDDDSDYNELMPKHDLWQNEKAFRRECITAVEDLIRPFGLVSREMAIIQLKKKLKGVENRILSLPQAQVFERMICELETTSDEDFEAFKRFVLGE